MIVMRNGERVRIEGRLEALIEDMLNIERELQHTDLKLIYHIRGPKFKRVIEIYSEEIRISPGS